MTRTQRHALHVILIVLILLTILFILGEKSFDEVVRYTPPPTTQTAAVADFNSSLIAHYTFDGNTNDSAGSNTGTASGGPTYVTGRIGQAIQFDGVDDVVQTPSDFVGIGPVTITAWIKPNTFGESNLGTIVTNGKLYFRLRGVSAAFEYRAIGNSPSGTGPNSITLGSWQFVAMTRDGTNANLYLNGSLTGPANQTNEAPIAGSYPVMIGNRQGQDLTFDGSIDDLRIYNRVLSAQEIAELYAYTGDTGGGTITPPPPPPPPPDPTPTTYTLTVSKSGTGSGAITGNSISCGNTCSQSNITSGTQVTLTASPSGSDTFTGWSGGGCSGTGTCTVTISANTTVTATFAAPVAQNPIPTSGNRVDLLSSSGGLVNTFTTIRACATVAVAGQTCFVYPGTYEERVTVPNSGISGSPITFRASGGVVTRGFVVLSKNFITIDGFEITGAMPSDAAISIVRSSDVSALNNNIHHTTGGIYATGISLSSAPNSRIINNRISNIGGMGGIRMSCNTTADFSDNTIIRGNVIAYISIGGTSSGPGISLCGNGVISENNDISHVADFTTVGSSGSAGYVIRNNEFHDVAVSDWATSPHIDGVQGYGSQMLVENNYMHDVEEMDKNVHFVLFGGERGGSRAIVRYNMVRDIDSSFSDGQYGFDEMKVYNNTLARTSRGVNMHGTAMGFGNGSGAVVGGALLNNLFFDASTGCTVYAFIRDSLTNARADYNLFYKTAGDCASDRWNVGYPVPPQADVHGIKNRNPLLADTTSRNFSLQSSSPAIDAGGPLTTATGAGNNSTVLQVSDAGFFQDGWAGVTPDRIAVGSTGNSAQIFSINYTTNVITLASPLTWNSGDPVYLYSDSTGRQVLYGSTPDIGAFEYNNGQTYTPTPQTPVTPTQPASSADFNHDGAVNTLDFSLMVSAWNTTSSIYDLNHDSTVNTLDYSIMAGQWTK